MKGEGALPAWPQAARNFSWSTHVYFLKNSSAEMRYAAVSKRMFINAPIKDEAAYLAIRNRPGVLAMIVATHALASLLTGYVLAKLA